MGILTIIMLSVLQGITEFLPVSSSAHLLLFPYLLKIQDQGLVIDIFLHLGSFLAVLVFYKRDIYNILRESFKNLKKSLFLKLFVATLPIVLFGGVLYLLGIEFRNPKIVIYTSLIFGVILYCADKYSKKNKRLQNLTFKQSIVIGLAQMLAIIPGVSRSGITSSMALIFNQDRKSALKFSFLLSIPTIFLSGCLAGVKIVNEGVVFNVIDVFLLLAFSFVCSLLVIKFMTGWVKKSSFKIFAVYRILLAIFLYLYLK